MSWWLNTITIQKKTKYLVKFIVILDILTKIEHSCKRSFFFLSSSSTQKKKGKGQIKCKYVKKKKPQCWTRGNLVGDKKNFFFLNGSFKNYQLTGYLVEFGSR